MYTTQKIESTLELPFHLIDIHTGSEHFVFQFKAFDDNQTDYSVKMGGVTGKFGIIFESNGIHSDFVCDITVGNVYEFYAALTNAYDMPGQESVAVLKNYGVALNRTNLMIAFDKKGHCHMDGLFMNKDNRYQSGITFSFVVDQTFIADILNSMEVFFQELRRIQGHGNFY